MNLYAKLYIHSPHIWYSCCCVWHTLRWKLLNMLALLCGVTSTVHPFQYSLLLCVMFFIVPRRAVWPWFPPLFAILSMANGISKMKEARKEDSSPPPPFRPTASSRRGERYRADVRIYTIWLHCGTFAWMLWMMQKTKSTDKTCRRLLGWWKVESRERRGHFHGIYVIKSCVGWGGTMGWSSSSGARVFHRAGLELF